MAAAVRLVQRANLYSILMPHGSTLIMLIRDTPAIRRIFKLKKGAAVLTFATQDIYIILEKKLCVQAVIK